MVVVRPVPGKPGDEDVVPVMLDIQSERKSLQCPVLSDDLLQRRDIVDLLHADGGCGAPPAQRRRREFEGMAVAGGGSFLHQYSLRLVYRFIRMPTMAAFDNSADPP